MTQNAWEENQIPQIVIERNPSWPVVPVVTISIVSVGLVKDADITAQCGVAHRLLLRYIDTGVRTKYAALATLPTFNGHRPNFISTQNLVPKSHLVFGTLLHILERKMLSAIHWELLTNLVCHQKSCKKTMPRINLRTPAVYRNKLIHVHHTQTPWKHGHLNNLCFVSKSLPSPFKITLKNKRLSAVVIN